MYFLEDETIGLRQLTKDDADGNYSTWFDDSIICKFNSHHRFPMYKQEIIAYIEGLVNDHSRIVLAVDMKSTNCHIGNISLQNIDNINNQCEIAFIFGESKFWGKGYATKAAKLLIHHAFYELNMNRVYFGTLDTNIGMQRVGEKLGFIKEGVKREAMYKNGKYHDVIDYALLKKEWNTSVDEEK